MRGLAGKSNYEKRWWQGLAGFLNICLVVAIVTFFVIYVINRREQLIELFSLSAVTVFCLFFLTFGGVFSRGLVNFFLYRRIDCPVTVTESVGLAIINTIGNLLPLSGGLIGKGVYLKHRHRLSYRRYFSATAALSVLLLAANGLAGILALGYLGLTGSRAPLYLFGGFFALCLSMLVFVLPITHLMPKRWREGLVNAHMGWSFITESWPAVSAIIVLKLMGIGFTAGRLWLIFSAFSQGLGFAHCVVFSAGATLTSFFNITPGGLGVREAIVGGLSAVLGFQFGLAVFVTVIDRLVGLLGAGIMAAFVLPRRKAEIKQNGVAG